MIVMREQPAQIFEVLSGPTELFVAALCKPPQHNEHCKGWRWEMYLQDAKLREANVRACALAIMARARRVEFQEAAE